MVEYKEAYFSGINENYVFYSITWNFIKTCGLRFT